MELRNDNTTIAAIDCTKLLAGVRMRAPRSIRSAVRAIDEVLGGMLPTDACALTIPSERTVYLSNRIPGIAAAAVYEAIGLPRGSGYRRVILGGERESGGAADADGGLSVCAVPVYGGRRVAAHLTLIRRGGDPFEDSGGESLPRIQETLSAILHRYITGSRVSSEERRARSLRAEILESIGDELMMRRVLARVMEISKAEFCAFYTALDEDYFYLLLDGAELTPHTPEIREKVRTTYYMFSNRSDGDLPPHEHVFVRNRDRNLAYLLGDVRIESYFLVPVTFDARVRGVLYFGSVTKDAFAREDIAVFHRLAAEDGERIPLRFRIGGETGIIGRMVGVLPYGGALIARDGAVRYANERFRGVLGIHESVPDTITDMGSASPYNLQGLWEEFHILEHDIVDRELHGAAGHERTLAVTWVRLDGLSDDVESLILIKDISHERDQEEAREEMMATVAHELRTPMTALKNSLAIMKESVAGGAGAEDGACRAASSRFLDTALRTVRRLNVLVDGIVDASTFRMPDDALRPVDVDVNEFLHESSYLFAESMRKKGIRFETEVDASVSTLSFDRDRMEQVIQNLLSNSMKHVPSGGRISITVSAAPGAPEELIPPIPWRYLWRPDFACIRVRDTGSGIPAPVVDEINRQNRGTDGGVRPAHGLGLYIATRLVRRHGGTLHIERPDDEGSVVSIHLPMRVETGSVIRRVRAIERIIAETIGKGVNPILYAIVRRGPHSWRAIAAHMRASTVLNPARRAIEKDGCYLWPLGRDYAVAVATVRNGYQDGITAREIDAEEILFVGKDRPDDVDVGWGIAPQDGTSYAELAAASLERIGAEPVYAVRKGAIG